MLRDVIGRMGADGVQRPSMGWFADTVFGHGANLAVRAERAMLAIQVRLGGHPSGAPLTRAAQELVTNYPGVYSPRSDGPVIPPERRDAIRQAIADAHDRAIRLPLDVCYIACDDPEPTTGTIEFDNPEEMARWILDHPECLITYIEVQE